jgi:hypothetical protein
MWIFGIHKSWAANSAVRVPALQAGGHKFESCAAHQVIDSVDTLNPNPSGRGFLVCLLPPQTSANLVNRRI